MKNYGVMQGRLIPDENGRIQSFPRKGWRQEFSILQSLGISFLEWTIDKQDLWENPLLTTVGRREILDLSIENDVSVISATGDNLMQAPLHKKSNGLTTSIAECEDFIGNLTAAGIEILVWPLVDSGNLGSRDELEHFIDKFSRLIPLLEKVGIKVAFETDLNAYENYELLTFLNSNQVGINVDIGNLASYGYSVADEFSLLKDSIFHVHIKDRIVGGGTVPLGEGDVDWNEVSHVLSDNYNGIKVLQAARKPDSVGALREYLRFCEMMNV